MKAGIAPALLVACLAVACLGWAVTPHVDGEPILLSPAVRGVLRYAGQGMRWTDDLAGTGQLLLGALPVAGGNVALPGPSPARVDPGTLLTYADQARQAKALAVGVAKSANTTRPPEGLEGLHEAALNLAQGYADVAALVQAYLGLPTAGEATRIGRALADLAAQRAALARDYQALALRRRAFRLR